MSGLVVGRWGLGLERLVPPPVGALTGGPPIGRHSRRGSVRRTGKRSRAQFPIRAVGDGEPVSRPCDGDDTPMMQPVMIRTQQDEVVQLGRAAVFPMPDVMGVQTTSSATTRHRTRGMTMLEGTTKPTVERHAQVEIRATVAPAPISAVARESYRPKALA